MSRYALFTAYGQLISALLAARDQGVKRFVYASSSSVYGDTAVLPKVETMTPNPLSPYAVSKHVGELYCAVFARVYGLETVTLRYFNVFGPRQDPNSQYAAVIPRFVSALAEGKAPTIFGDGEQTRDFTFIDNVVQANILAATADHPDLPGKAMNIGCGGRYSINELLRHLQEIMGTDVTPSYVAPRPGDVRDSQADITLARTLIGYEPSVELREGLEKTVAWFQARRVS
jgi:nucleoside-diphosphate-sugar epimerase